jgi:prophage antirepressor-like protein
MIRKKTKIDEDEKNECLTLKFKENKVRITGRITCCWLAADDIYLILGKGNPDKKVEIDELIAAGVEINNLSTSDLGIVVNLMGLMRLVKWGKEINENRATEFKEWIFNEMFPKIWMWADNKYKVSH